MDPYDDERYRRPDDEEPRPRRRPTTGRTRRLDDEDAPPRGGAGRRRENFVERRMAGRDDDYDDYDDDYEPRAYPRSAGYMPPPAYARRGNGCAATALYALLGLLAIAVLLVIVGPRILSAITARLPQSVNQVIATPTPTLVDRGGTIQQIRSLNRLETQSFAVERIVEASQQRGNALDMFLGEKLLLIASGNVIAGVDLSKLQAQDVVISDDGTSISLTLPPSEIFLATLDNTRTRVYDRQTGIGTRLFGGENKDLETIARQNAESEILKAACEGGIMQKSADEARTAMEQFLRLAGFERINVNAPAGPCTATPTVQAVPTQTP